MTSSGIGGDLLMPPMRVMVRLRQSFGPDLPLRLLFDHPVLEALAAQLEATDKRPGGGRHRRTARYSRGTCVMNYQLTSDLLRLSRDYAKLPAEKRGQFRRILRDRGIPASRLPIVPLSMEGGRRPLSRMQQQLWFPSQLDPDSAAYNMPWHDRAGRAGRYHCPAPGAGAAGRAPRDPAHPLRRTG